MITRETIARWLSPKMAREADRYNRMFGQMITEKHWLSEFPDVSAALQRLLDSDYNYWRSPGEPHIGDLPDGINEFREILRRRHILTESSILKAVLARLQEANSRQASCIHQCAAAIGPDTAGTIDGLPRAVKHLVEQLRQAREGVADEKTVDAILQVVSDIMVDAHVSYPAGREAGTMIEYEEEELRQKVVDILSASAGPLKDAANG